MNNNEDIIDVSVLEDGRIKFTTDPISPENHVSAEGFFRTLARLTGGEMQKAPRHKSHKHQHHHKEKVRQR